MPSNPQAAEAPQVVVRHPGSGPAPPPGWVAEELICGRVVREVVYDPRRYSVVRHNDEHGPREGRRTRAELAATGWQRLPDDAVGELWVLDRRQAQIARLNRLPTTGPEPLSVA
jgi:hypothetical protein